MASANGVVRLQFSTPNGIMELKDTGGEVPEPGDPVDFSIPWSPAEHTYTLDNTAPALSITGVPSNGEGPFTATFTFDEDVTGFTASDISVTGGSKGTFTETTPRTVWTLVITPSANYTVAVAADAATDVAGNGNAAVSASGMYDTTAPTITAIQRANPITSPTNADILVWWMTFSEDVQNVTADDFAIDGFHGLPVRGPAQFCRFL